MRVRGFKNLWMVGYGFIFLAGVAIFVGINWFFFWSMPKILRFKSPLLGYFVGKGPVATVTYLICVGSAAVVIGLFLLYWYTRAFDPALRSSEFWYKLTLKWLLVVEAGSVIVYAFLRNLWGYQRNEFPTYVFDASIRVVFVITLLTIGIAVYIFKQKSKILYGLSEMLIGILSNLAVIEHIQITNSLGVHLSADEWIKVGAFTYLLGSGFANVADGVKARMNGPTDGC